MKDWRAGECEPVPGKTMPKLIEVEREYGKTLEKFTSLGPLVEKLGTPWKGLNWKPTEEVEALRKLNGTTREGAGAGRPKLVTAENVCEGILQLSGTSNGRIAVESFKVLEERSGMKLTDLAEDRSDERLSFRDVGIQPRKTITSAEWSGISPAIDAIRLSQSTLIG